MKPIVSMVPQRHPSDCGVSVLSMFLQVSYEEALLAISKDAPRVLRTGMWFTEVRRAAKRLGVPLRLKRRWNALTDEGILYVKNRRGPNHLILLRERLLWDTNFEVWRLDDYRKASGATFGALLVKGEA